MRDVLVTLIVIGSLPVILRRPWIGILVWSWLGYMNPHRLTWGFAYDFPFSQIVAITTLIGLVFSAEPKRFPLNSLTFFVFLLIFWMTVSTIFAVYPDLAWPKWEQTMKILLFALVTMVLMRDKERLNYLVWMIVLCIGFYGVKGGIFSTLTGGEYRIWGPEKSFIMDNNAIGLAMVMTLPLIWYLYLNTVDKRLRIGLLAAGALTALAILTTHSRGAFLSIAAMFGFMWLKSRNKAWLTIVLILGLPILYMFMPESWHERMATISNYQEDGSAMGRINAWWFSWNLALDKPLVGGGFHVYSQELFYAYAPDPEDFHDSHSIYFAMMAEHGFVGLAIFLIVGVLSLRMAGRVARTARQLPDMQWAADLALMLQVCLVGYAVGGAFLGFAYFDLYYHYIAIIVLLNAIVKDRQTAAAAENRKAAPGIHGVAGVRQPGHMAKIQRE